MFVLAMYSSERGQDARQGVAPPAAGKENYILRVKISCKWWLGEENQVLYGEFLHGKEMVKVQKRLKQKGGSGLMVFITEAGFQENAVRLGMSSQDGGPHPP